MPPKDCQLRSTDQFLLLWSLLRELDLGAANLVSTSRERIAGRDETRACARLPKEAEIDRQAPTFQQ